MPHSVALTPAPSLTASNRRLHRVFGLLAVTAAVLLVHGLLLHSLPAVLVMHSDSSSDPAPDLGQQAFTTRAIGPTESENSPPASVPEPAIEPQAMPAIANAPPPEAASPVPPPNSAANPDGNNPNTTETAVPETMAAALPSEPATAPPSGVAPVPKPGAESPVRVAAQTFAFPNSVRLLYDVLGETKGISYTATSEMLWLQNGKTYDARLEVSHFLLGSVIVQTSKGELTSKGLEPVRFGDKRRSEVAAHFERSKNKISFSANTPDAPLQPGAQDQLSIYLQLASMLGGEPARFVTGGSIAMQLVGPRSTEQRVFSVGNSEALVLPGGSTVALKLSSDARAEYDTGVAVWLAPAMGYLPVRIRLSQSNGDLLELRWRATQVP